MPAYIASLVAACIATSFTAAANGEGVPQVASLPASSSFLANPPVAYLVAAPIAGPPTPSELRAQRARARAARQTQATPLRGVPYTPPNDQAVMEGFAASAPPPSEGTQSEVNNRLGPTPRGTRARQRSVAGDFKGLDISGMTPTQLRDLKSFIHLAQGSSTGSLSPFLAPIVPITAEDLARIQEHLLTDNAKSEPEEADAQVAAVAAVAESTSSQLPAPSTSGTTVIDRPVFVDRQGGPLVIIQQHAHHQEDDSEPLLHSEIEQSESAVAMSAESPISNEDDAVSHLADMEPIEYVPFALIDRDGRVAILERNMKSTPPLSSTANALTGAEVEAPTTTPAPSRDAPKPLPAAIRKQLEEGRLPAPPPFMFGPHANGGWLPPPPGAFPFPRSQERAAGENNKEFYLAPAAGFNRPNGQKFPAPPSSLVGQQKPASKTTTNEGQPILIRMPNPTEGGDSKEWSPTALLLGKGPATVRRAVEVEQPSETSPVGVSDDKASS